MTLVPFQNCRIEAQPIDARRCRLVVDQPLFPERWAFFRNRCDPDLENAPIVARVFRIPDVQSVLLSHDKLTITRALARETPVLGPALRVVRALTGAPSAISGTWRHLAGQVATEIRAQLASGEPSILDPSRIAVPLKLELKARIEAVLEADVNPVIAAHGGGVSIVDLIDNVVYLKMTGGCQGCGLADMTLKHGVEAALRDQIPEIGEIIDLTDHAGGLRPFSKFKGNDASPFPDRSRRR